MRVVPVDLLKPGFIMGRPLVDSMGKVLLQKGVQLTADYIQLLRNKGYTRLFIREEDEPDIAIEEDISPAVRAQATQSLRTAFESIEKELDPLRKSSFEDILNGFDADRVKKLMSSTGPLAGVLAAANQVVEDVLTQRTLAGLTSLKGMDSALYDHSIDVCVVAIMIGRVVGLSSARMRQLATGCLLHDIGMVFVEADQPEPRRIRQHTKLGYELLRNCDDPDIMSPHVAYEHHEHQDGTGLPRGLVGSNRLERNRSVSTPIPALIGEIAAVANMYDTLLSGTKDRSPLSPDAALGEIAHVSGTWLNKEVVTAFRRVVPVYPKGTQIVIRGGQYHNCVGVVKEISTEHLDRPVLLLIRNTQGKPIEQVEVDTKEIPDILLQTIGL